MKRFALFVASLMLPLLAAAQVAGGISMKVAGADPVQPSPVRLSTLDVQVEVMGNIASTTLDMTFVNGTDSVLEGEFEFPLGENESVTGYALDINGKMRPGVVVEKDKGRQVFEAVVRQGIDPGLVEMTAGNNFKTRVYPLPAKGSRRIQLSYQSELRTNLEPPTAVSSRPAPFRTYQFSALPGGKLDSFSFKLTVLDSSQRPSPALDPADSKKGELGYYTFEDMQSGYTAQLSRQDFLLAQPLIIRIPESSAAEASPVFTQDIGTETFFYYYAPLQEAGREKPLPKKLVVYYDISASAARRDLKAETQLLAAYLSKLGGGEGLSVTVVPFCNELYEAKEFSGGSEAIINGILEYVQKDGFDGATNLGYDFASLFPADEVLVFTDGLGNWDDSRHVPKALAKRPVLPRVYTVNSSPVANHAWLQQTAMRQGGQYINLCAVDGAQALSLLTDDPLRLIRASYDAAAVGDLYPLDGSIASGGFSLSGKLKRKSADVTLQFGHGNTVERTVTVTVSAVDGIPSEHVAYQWAAKKIAALGADYEANRNEIVETAKQFRVVTQDTSLIVLDSASDYLRYGIVPPKSDAALYAEYERLASRQNTAAKPVGTEDSRSIPQAVYRTFEEFRSWWNTSVDEFRRRKQKGKPGQPVPVPRDPTRPVIMEDGAEMSYSMSSVSEAVAAEPEVYMDAAPAPMVESEAPMARQMNGRAAAGSSSARAAQASSPAQAASKQAQAAPAAATIQLQAWNPDAGYLSVLKRTPTAAMYRKYLDLKEQYASSPAFYMEVSDYFAAEGLEAESLRILSNLAELDLENSDILRALGNKLVERELYRLAIPVFEKLVKLRGEIPQFLRDLGMAYYYGGYEQKAVDTLYGVASKSWDARFAEVQQIALNDMNAIVALSKGGVDTSAIDKKLLQNFDVDVRVVLTWNTDSCDVDLWVTDADGEKCFYGNKLTANGARMSRDFTQGYGPEEFCIKIAPGGTLKIEANYFGNHQQKLLQPVTVQAEVYTNFGRADQKRQLLTLQLDSVKQTFFIGDVAY